MTDQELLQQGYTLLRSGTLYAKWANSNPGEAAKLDGYIQALLGGESPPAPSLATWTGRGFVAWASMGAEPTPPPPPPPSRTIPRYGISTGAPDSQFSATLSQCKAIGAEYVRFDYAHDSAGISRVNTVHGNGQHALLILPKKSPGAMGTDVARYWRDRLPLRMYEIMNEPDLNGWTAATYAPVAKQWCDQIKAADPEAVIWLPGSFKGGDQAGKTSPDFARAVCDAGCDFDVWSGHYFDDDPAWNDPRNGWHYARTVRDVLDASGRKDVVIASSESHAFYREGAEQQARKVRQYLTYASGTALTLPTLASVAIYRMNYSETGSWDSSLLNPDGSARPAWTAFKEFVGAT